MVHQTPPAPLVEALLLMVKELITQLSEARDDYNHLKADMAAHDARLSAIEQYLACPGSNPITPHVTLPMDTSPQGSSTIVSPTPQPPISTATPVSQSFI